MNIIKAHQKRILSLLWEGLIALEKLSKVLNRVIVDQRTGQYPILSWPLVTHGGVNDLETLIIFFSYN